MAKKMAKRKFEPGHRIMVRKGLHENDTIAFVGVRGTVVNVYSSDPTGKDRNEFCIAVRLDSRSGRDTDILFKAGQLAASNPKGK